MLSEDLLSGALAIARFLNTTERAAYHMLYLGKIPAFKRGGRWYARKSEIEAAFRAGPANV